MDDFKNMKFWYIHNPSGFYDYLYKQWKQQKEYGDFYAFIHAFRDKHKISYKLIDEVYLYYCCNHKC